MSKELVIQGDFEKGLANIEKLESACQLLMKNPAYKKYGYEGICAIVARAKALNIDPFQALNNGFYVVQGKIGMSTEMMAALVRRAGHSVTKDPKSSNECVILHGKRSDNGDEWVSTYSKEDAIQAGLWNSMTWKKYPAIMLYNRAMSVLFRQLFPDLSLGAGYIPDEIDEITKTGDYKNLQEAEVEEVIEKISLEECVELTRLCNLMPENSKKGCNDWIKSLGYSSLGEIKRDDYNKIKKRVEATIEQKTKDEEEALPY